jgi:hypothetical protein
VKKEKRVYSLGTDHCACVCILFMDGEIHQIESYIYSRAGSPASRVAARDIHSHERAISFEFARLWWAAMK